MRKREREGRSEYGKRKVEGRRKEREMDTQEQKKGGISIQKMRDKNMFCGKNRGVYREIEEEKKLERDIREKEYLIGKIQCGMDR